MLPGDNSGCTRLVRRAASGSGNLAGSGWILLSDLSRCYRHDLSWSTYQSLSIYNIKMVHILFIYTYIQSSYTWLCLLLLCIDLDDPPIFFLAKWSKLYVFTYRYSIYVYTSKWLKNIAYLNELAMYMYIHTYLRCKLSSYLSLHIHI